MGPKTYLVVEDDDLDRKALRKAFEGAVKTNPVWFADNGLEALMMLAPGSEQVRPDVILLDLTMPQVDGFEFLERRQTNGHLRSIPTVVMTSSGRPEDCKKSYELGAAGYVRKPDSMAGYRDLISDIHRYWERCERAA